MPNSAALAWLLLAVALCVAAAPLAHAEPSKNDRALYRRLVNEAVAEYGRGAWAEARTLFAQAHELQPNARTHRGLGLTSFELGRYVEALVELEAALADTRNPLSPKQRAEAGEVIERARRYVGTVRIEVDPADATLLLDGQVVTEHELRLNVGEYTLAARADGYTDVSRKLDVEGGQTRTLRIELVPRHAATAAAPSESAVAPPLATDAEPSSEGDLQRLLGWTAVGVGVVGLALGVVFELQRSDKLSQRDAICPTSVDCMEGDDVKIAALEGDARSAGTVEVVSFIAGGVFAAGGLVLVFTAPSSPDSEAAITLAPRAGRGSYGLSLSGTF